MDGESADPGIGGQQFIDHIRHVHEPVFWNVIQHRRMHRVKAGVDEFRAHGLFLNPNDPGSLQLGDAVLALVALFFQRHGDGVVLEGVEMQKFLHGNTGQQVTLNRSQI